MASFIPYNPNPCGKFSSGDCVVRALCKVLVKSWEEMYVILSIEGFMECDVFTANNVWGNYLISQGFEEHSLMRGCKSCYTLLDFCRDHSSGVFVVGTDSHAVAVIDGNYYDSFNSGNMNPTYYFEKKEGV